MLMRCKNYGKRSRRRTQRFSKIFRAHHAVIFGVVQLSCHCYHDFANSVSAFKDGVVWTCEGRGVKPRATLVLFCLWNKKTEHSITLRAGKT